MNGKGGCIGFSNSVAAQTWAGKMKRILNLPMSMPLQTSGNRLQRESATTVDAGLLWAFLY